MMDSATNKLLHAPTTRLKAAASSSDAGDLVDALDTLFELPKSTAEPDDHQRDSRVLKTEPAAHDALPEEHLPH
jgi:hypothetical protein